MAKLRLLGTSSGLLHPDRYPSAYLLDTSKGDILLDCGEPVSSTLARMNYNWNRLRGIIITHTHADHLGGFPMVIQQLHLSGKNNNLTIYCPGQYKEKLPEHLALYYLFLEKFKFDIKTFSMSSEKTFSILDEEITPFANRHLDKMKQVLPSSESFSLKIKIKNQNLFYSGDVASFEDIRTPIKDCNFILVESTHLDTEELMKWAGENPETKIILTHIAPDFALEDFKTLRGKYGLKNISIGEDGKIINI